MKTTKLRKGEDSAAAEYCYQTKSLITYSGYANPPVNFPGDHNGDFIFSGVTVELMHSPAVRVIIEPGTSKASALRLLEEILTTIKDSPESNFPTDEIWF